MIAAKFIFETISVAVAQTSVDGRKTVGSDIRPHTSMKDEPSSAFVSAGTLKRLKIA